MNTTIHWLTTAFDGLVAFLPNLVAGLIILLVGWLIAALLARAVTALAHRLGFDRHVAKLGISTQREGYSGSRLLGSLVYAIVMVVTIMQAARAWNLDFIAYGLASVIAYLPHAIGAVLVFAASLYIGNWVRERLYRKRALATDETGVATTTFGGGKILPELVRGAIIAVGAFMALRELQVAPEIVNAAFMLTLGALAVATALAFGLGGREVAGRIAQSWWDRRSMLGPMSPPSGRPEVRA
jgi:hypothetical protein